MRGEREPLQWRQAELWRQLVHSHLQWPPQAHYDLRFILQLHALLKLRSFRR